MQLRFVTATPHASLPTRISLDRLQNRDWRQARKRTAEGRFVNDSAELDQPGAPAQSSGKAGAPPSRLQERVTSLADVKAPLQEDGELPEPPSVRIGQRLTKLGYAMPGPGALASLYVRRPRTKPAEF